jgi:hypothetical protein
VDPAPRPFEELPLDAVLSVPVPFACGTGDEADASRLDHRRVTQCALSRVCGVCGTGLGRPIAFFGSEDEANRLAFHFPPTHLECAERLLEAYVDVRAGVLGQLAPVERWTVMTTAGFEFVRPSSSDFDRRPTFQPNSMLEAR